MTLQQGRDGEEEEIPRPDGMTTRDNPDSRRPLNLGKLGWFVGVDSEPTDEDPAGQRTDIDPSAGAGLDSPADLGQ